MSTSDVVVAKDGFSATLDGHPRAVAKGETFRAGHPIVEGREHLFKPFEIDNDFERATAAPGEKRAKRPRAKKAEQKSDEPAEKGEEGPKTDDAKAGATKATDTKATAAPGENGSDAAKSSTDSANAASTTD
jgi:hypothetical protein